MECVTRKCVCCHLALICWWNRCLSWLLWFFFRISILCFSSHVLTEDTISREIRNGKLHSKRLLSKTNSLPKWGERFYNAKSVKIVEESVVDPKEKTLTTYTRNIAFTKVMVSKVFLTLMVELDSSLYNSKASDIVQTCDRETKEFFILIRLVFHIIFFVTNLLL